MDIKSFRKCVTDSIIRDKLNSLELVLQYNHLEFKEEFKGIQSVYKFIYNQVIGWNNFDKIPQYLDFSKKHFESLKSRLITLTNNFEESKHSEFDYNWRQLVELIKSQKDSNAYFIFLYESSETDLILKLNNRKPNYLQGAIDYLTGTNLRSQSNTDYFTGALIGYEFKNQVESEILQRRNSEKISLGRIRDKYNEYIVEAEQQLNANLSDAKDNLTIHFETIDQLKDEKNKSFEQWFAKSGNEFDDFYSKAQQAITDNENLYREKLRLEAPAKYWKDRAILLKSEGDKYLNWLIKTSVIAAILLFILLMTLGTEFYETAFNDRIKGIKWSIILITIVSLLAFIIKILSKMTFSSFHLSRDAEEREQLTHFYLALKKDTTIEPEERQLILQSLFSRADTGLLKDDSSPTMPTSIIEKFSGAR
jgi:hypothetical protein